MNDYIKTTISTQENFFDEAGQLVPKGNYYFKLNKFEHDMCIGELTCKGSYGHFAFKPLDMIKMMSIGQSRLARRTSLDEDQLPNYDSPLSSPSNFHVTRNNFLSSNFTKNTIVNTFENNYEKCSICMQDISNNSKTLICSHIYHRSCINIWLNNANTCPVCRRVVQEELPNLRLPSRFPSRFTPAPPVSTPPRNQQQPPSSIQRQSRYVVRDTHIDLFSPSYNLSPTSDIIRQRSERRLNQIRNRYAFS